MKNLKKVLALVLAFACAFTMFAGAAFTDEADINADNRDAVELLTALNIIQGYEDGSFDPEGTVTRAEMAKMIYTIRNGGNDDASAYETVTTTFQDINGHWAEGYIKYLQNTGIVAGNSPTEFDPDSQVTTGEAMKMALVLSGYRADKAGLTGTAWLNNTVAQATTVGMTKDVQSAIASGCTRQDAAQILSNTLTEVYAVQWSEVTSSFLYDSKEGLAWGGHRITVGSKWMDLAIDTGYLTKGPSSKTNPKGITFVGDEYGTKTFRDTTIDVSDLFGYEVKVVWDADHEDDVDGVYGIYKTADNSDVSAMWKDVKNDSAKKFKIDGETYTADAANIDVYLNSHDTVTMDVSTIDEQAYADIVTFIDNNADGEMDVAVVNNQNVVKVTYVSDDVLNTSDVIGDSAPYTIADLRKNGGYDVDPGMDDVITYDGIAKNDYAKVTYDYYNDKVVYEKIDPVEATIEATRTKSGTQEIRIDGNWYKAAEGYTLPSLVSGDSIEFIAIDNLLYNVEKIDGIWGSKNLAIVYDTARYAAGVNANDLQIKLLTRDGDKKTVILDEYNKVDVTFAPGGSGNDYNIDLDLDGVADESIDASADNALLGQLVTYRESGSEVSLMPVDMDSSKNFTQKAGYDDLYETNGASTSYDEDNNTIAVTAKNESAMTADVKIADSAVVFVWDTKGDAKVVSGSELGKAEQAAAGVSNIVAGGTENGVYYVQAAALKYTDVDDVDAAGENYAYVLRASETVDGEDYRYFELWTENGFLEAYEENSDEYTYENGQIVTYEIVSTGDRTIIKNVDPVAEGGTFGTLVGYITSDGFYDNDNKIAIQNREYELASDCVVINIDTDEMYGIEGDAMSAAREAKKTAGVYDDNIVYVLNTQNEVVFIMIDGKNNEIMDKTLYE